MYCFTVRPRLSNFIKIYYIFYIKNDTCKVHFMLILQKNVNSYTMKIIILLCYCTEVC